MHNQRTRRRALAAATVLALTATPAIAISDGVIDSEHPNVGALILRPDLDDPDLRFPICSGSLLTPTTFLTSAHCVIWLPGEGFTADNLQVTFEVEGRAGSVFVQAVAYDMAPDALRRNNDANDVAVVTLEAPVEGLTPIEVAPVGWLDEAAAKGGLTDHSFTNVGYGVQSNEQGKPSYEYDGMRRRSTSPFQALTKAYLWLNMNSTASDEGGSCFGDSGGPKFVGAAGEPDGNLVVAITFGGNKNCRGGNFNQRLDIPVIADFLAPFLAG